jgi:putative ABC transport system ATP-binding protein
MSVMRKLVDERGVSVIVATHDPLLIGMGDQVIQLRDGAVVPRADEVVPAAARVVGSS